MTKAQAIRLFGSSRTLASALGVTRQRVSQLPEDLRLYEVDRIAGAALRLGLIRGWGDLHRKLSRSA